MINNRVKDACSWKYVLNTMQYWRFSAINFFFCGNGKTIRANEPLCERLYYCIDPVCINCCLLCVQAPAGSRTVQCVCVSVCAQHSG